MKIQYKPGRDDEYAPWPLAVLGALIAIAFFASIVLAAAGKVPFAEPHHDQAAVPSGPTPAK